MLNQALETGGIAVVDELDLAIHPLCCPKYSGGFMTANVILTTLSFG